jgi:hypothetical protein
MLQKPIYSIFVFCLQNFIIFTFLFFRIIFGRTCYGTTVAVGSPRLWIRNELTAGGYMAG